MNEKLFFDIHCHAMNLSHPNMLAFIKRLPWRLLGLVGIPILSFLITLLGKKVINRLLNLLSVMENDVGDIFLIMEFYLKNGGLIEHDALIENDVLTIDYTDYNAIVLTPLLIDFAFKKIKSETYYRIPPEKPIIPQTVDVFNGIRKYYSCELRESSPGKYEILKREGRAIFEIYPFLGLNTQHYDLDAVEGMLQKYFGRYTGSHTALKENLGKFRGDIESLGSNFFAGIKVYPPIGYDPWPERDDEQLAKVTSLYECCCAKKIPITAHCSEVGFNLDKKNVKTYTSPFTWEKVLNQEAYRDLKLNLAHFGEQRNFLLMFHNHKWQHKIVELIEKYPNVYTDFSYRAFHNNYYKSLKEIIGNTDRLSKRILFGTDFMINLLEIDSYNKYLNNFRTTKYITSHEKELFCSTNPERFLFV